jgi:predicted ATPase/class 3 adenylate cyclase
LKQKCRNCSAEAPLEDRFCGKCGAPLQTNGEGLRTQPSGSPAGANLQDHMLRNLRAKMPTSMVDKFIQGSKELYGQRREVTVLVVEIANLASISREIDSETSYLAAEEIVNLLTAVVYKYEGTIDKHSGTGIMALFGLPNNHENDPERAVRAALEMHHALIQLSDHLKDRYNRDFELKIGINTGSVIAGYASGHQHLEYTVIGDTVHMATQLQRLAGPGTILASFSTYQRTRPVIDYQNLAPLSLADASDPVKVYQPQGIRLVPGQVRGLPGLQVPMIGRREQLDKLIAIFDHVIDTNTSGIVFCCGEAGIGKSRLVVEFRNYLADRPVTTVLGTCALYMRITPYRVVADVLRNLLGISELDPVNEQRKILRARLEQLGLDRSDIIPYLMHVLGILNSDPVLEVRIKLLDPSMLLRQTHLALRMFLIAESRRTPLVLVFDDLHWVDQPSGQFLEYLCQSPENTPLLLVMVARDFERFAFAKSIRSAADKHIPKPDDVYLQPLIESDAHLLIGQLIQEDSGQAKEMKTLITARAGGNPYFTEELVRILMDHGGLVNQGGSWRLTGRAAELVKEVPGTLGDIILARFGHLPDPLRNVLLRASVLGDSFSVRLLAALMGEDVPDLSGSLVELEQRDFLLSTKFEIEDGYIFKHPLLSETIYKTLLKRDSRKLHSKVALAIETGDYWLPGERNQVLAFHLSESTRPASAIPYLLISAEKAYQNFANDTVVQLYRQALSLMDNLAGSIHVQKEQAHIGLAKALKFTGELEEASRLLTEIVDRIPESLAGMHPAEDFSFQNQIEALCELADIRAREGDLDFAVRLLKRGKDLLGEAGRMELPVLWRRLVDRLAWVYFRQRNLDEAYNLVDLALLDSPTSETEDPITLASLYNTMGGIYWTRSRYAEAIESVEHSLEIYKSLHYHWGMANSLSNLGILHYSTEKWPQAVEYLEQADRLRREYGDDPERPFNLTNLGEVLIDLGDYLNARSNLETSIEISKRLGLNIPHTHAEFGLCRLALVEGDPEAARGHLKIAGALIESLEEANDRVAQYYQLLALIEMLENNFQSAGLAAEKALAISQRGDIIEKQADALRVLGASNARLGRFEEAEKFLLDSIGLAQEMNDRFCEAKARFELGLLFGLWSQSDLSPSGECINHALSNLETAIQIFEDLGARYELQRAKNARLLLPAPASTDRYSRDAAEIEKQLSIARNQLKIPEGEWYLTTIFDVALRPKPGMDEEFIFETVAFLAPPVMELIRGNGGQVHHHQEGITAIFGAPVAHEDDPERAIETAMQIINFYNELDQQAELPVSIHLGSAMGKVVAGKVDRDPAAEFIAAGEPVHLARTIAGAGPSGKVWVTQSIHNHTAFRFEYTPVQSQVVKNLDGNTLFELEGLREQILPVRGLIGLKSPFIGREKELAAMEKMSRVLEGDTGGIIWIEGEAGIGKSRLMREFAKQVIKYDPLVLNGVCSARRTEFAFSLFSDLLMQVFEIQHNFTPKQINAQIDYRIHRWSSELVETRPFLQLLLGVQPSGEQGERINSMEPEQLRRQTFVAIHRVFSLLSAKQPLVIILDDLQWIDSISADLLLYLSHLVVSKRILFVCALRQKEISPFEPILARTRSMHPDQYIHLSIHPLTIAECRQLLNEFLASAGLPDSYLSLIVQQSGGNPYFIEEFVRLLVEKDFLRLVHGKLVANRTLQADALIVPASLESLIRARVDSLDASARQMLQVASVIGHRFNTALLSQVMERDDNQPVLSQLHSSGMLNQTIENDYWEFSHPLIEVIVYNSVLRAQRRILHQHTAVALERQWQDNEEEHAGELAYHYRKAEIYDRALHYLILAGERAASRHANDVAVSFFEQASELLDAVPGVGDEARWRIIHQMGEVYQFTGNYEASLAVLQSGHDLLESALLSPDKRAGIYRRMGDTAHKKGDQEQAILYLEQALEVIGEPCDNPSRVEAALIYARLGWCHFMKSDFEPAIEAVKKSMVYAGQAKSVTTLAMTENYLGGILYRQGDLLQAMQHTRTAMAYWQEIGYSWGVAAALSNLGILENASGNWQAAYNSIKRSLDLRQKMGDVDGVAITNHNLGQLLRTLGDVAQAELHYRDSLAVSRPFQMNWHAANSYVGLAQSLLCQGKIEEASGALKESFRLAQEINAPDVIVEAYCTKAEIQLANNRLADAEESAQSAARLASQIGVNPLMATALRLTSVCLLRQGFTQEACQALEKAWDALSDGPDQLENGRLHAQAMLISQAMKDLEQAQHHQEAARQIFKGLGASRDLAQLEAVEVP